jgi:hypothetical protein
MIFSSRIPLRWASSLVRKVCLPLSRLSRVSKYLLYNGVVIVSDQFLTVGKPKIMLARRGIMNGMPLKLWGFRIMLMRFRLLCLLIGGF